MRCSLFIPIVLSILVVNVGCRNRCNNGCGTGWFSGAQRITAPPTYSLNIPSAAKQPYYVPGQGSATRTALLDPSGAAPTPAGNQNSNNANLNGWRPVYPTNGANHQSGSSSPTGGYQPSIFASNGSTLPPGYRTASNIALPGSGRSFTNSTNYQTTRINETTDPTRLPLTDATTVRAPARYNPTAAPTRFSQLPGYTDGRYPATFNAPAAVRQPVYAANPVVVGSSSQIATNPVYMGQPLVGSRYPARPYMNPTMTVQGQSTTTADPNTQIGWRDREMGSDAFSR